MVNWLLQLFRIKPDNSKEIKNSKILNTYLTGTILSEECWPGVQLSSGGKWNWFLLDNGDYPTITHFIPEKRLVVLLGDIGSTDWADARAAGYRKADWAAKREAWSELLTKMRSVAALQDLVLWTITYNECSGLYDLNEQFKKLYTNIPEVSNDSE